MLKSLVRPTRHVTALTRVETRSWPTIARRLARAQVLSCRSLILTVGSLLACKRKSHWHTCKTEHYKSQSRVSRKAPLENLRNRHTHLQPSMETFLLELTGFTAAFDQYSCSNVPYGLGVVRFVIENQPAETIELGSSQGGYKTLPELDMCTVSSGLELRTVTQTLVTTRGKPTTRGRWQPARRQWKLPSFRTKFTRC